MELGRKPRYAGLSSLLLTLLVSCGARERDGETFIQHQAIVGGVPASAYPEAALIDLFDDHDQLIWHCSGSIIAPSVALTAGHCTTGAGGMTPVRWGVMAPYLGGQTSHATHSAAFDWQPTYLIDATRHDIGLVFLDTPIRVSEAECPALATTRLSDGASMVNIGRVGQGEISLTELYVSENMPARDGSSFGYPYTYVNAKNYLEITDSGGPDEVPGSSPHLIVAVNSAKIGTLDEEVLARVDLLNNAAQNWIPQQIQAHGGPCAPTTVGPDASVGQPGASANNPDASVGGPDAGDSGRTDAGAWVDEGRRPITSACAVGGTSGASGVVALLLVIAVLVRARSQSFVRQ